MPPRAGSHWVFWLTAMIMVCAIATVINTRPTRGPKATGNP